MRERCLALVGLLAACLLLSVPSYAGDAPGGYFKNPVWGYRVKVPKSWRRAALPTSETSVASKHLGKRELESARGNSWERERPEMWVIGFPKGGGGYPEYIKGQSDFLRWDYYSFSDGKELTIDGNKTTLYEIKYNRGRKEAEARHVIALVFHFDDVDLAVQFKILGRYYDEYKASFLACAKSLRRIPRTGALPGTGKAEESVDLDRLSPEERDRKLKDAVEKRFRKEIAALQGGWKQRRSERFLVLYNADEKFVRKAMKHAEAIRSHLEKFLGEKSGRYEPPSLMRIFSSDDERSAYEKGAGEGDGLVREVLLVTGKGWVEDTEFQKANQAIMSAWLAARHPLLEDMRPGWLETVLEKYADMLRTKRGKISYAKDDYDRDVIRLAIKRGEYTDLQNVIGRGLKGGGTGGAQLDSSKWGLQVRTFGFWILTKGNKGKYKNFVRDYLAELLRNLRDTEEIALAEALADQKARKKKKEEDSDGASPREFALTATKAKRDKILQTTFDRRFGGWGTKEWTRFTRAWLGHAK